MSKRIHIRPGKKQSKMSFLVGVVFCLMGVCIVIPIFGPFGIVWTAIAAIGAYASYKNGFTDEGIDSHVIEVEENDDDIHITKYAGYHNYSNTDSAKETTSKESAEKRLVRLQNLYDQSLITKEEYENKRREILEEL